MSEYELYLKTGSEYPSFKMDWEDYRLCPICGNALKYDKKFKRWWCDKCYWEEKNGGR